MKNTLVGSYCSIANNVLVAVRAVIMDGVSIGDGTIVATNAVVAKDVSPYAIVGGVPVKVISYRFDQEKIDCLLNSKWWDLPIEKINTAIEKKGCR